MSLIYGYFLIVKIVYNKASSLNVFYIRFKFQQKDLEIEVTYL